MRSDWIRPLLRYHGDDCLDDIPTVSDILRLVYSSPDHESLPAYLRVGVYLTDTVLDFGIVYREEEDKGGEEGVM